MKLSLQRRSHRGKARFKGQALAGLWLPGIIVSAHLIQFLISEQCPSSSLMGNRCPQAYKCFPSGFFSQRKPATLLGQETLPTPPPTATTATPWTQDVVSQAGKCFVIWGSGFVFWSQLPRSAHSETRWCSHISPHRPGCETQSVAY